MTQFSLISVRLCKYLITKPWQQHHVPTQAEEFEDMFNNQLETVKSLQSDLAVASSENQASKFLIKGQNNHPEFIHMLSLLHQQTAPNGTSITNITAQRDML
jgi:superoxide dismutase